MTVVSMDAVKIIVHAIPINFASVQMTTLEISVKHILEVIKIPAPTISVSMEVFVLWIQRLWRLDVFVIADTEESTVKITTMDNA